MNGKKFIAGLSSVALLLMTLSPAKAWVSNGNVVISRDPISQWIVLNGLFGGGNMYNGAVVTNGQGGAVVTNGNGGAVATNTDNTHIVVQRDPVSQWIVLSGLFGYGSPVGGYYYGSPFRTYYYGTPFNSYYYGSPFGQIRVF